MGALAIKHSQTNEVLFAIQLTKMIVSLEVKRVFSTVFLGVAQFMTVARIYIRYRNERLWWDDAWAFLAMILTVLLVVGIFLSNDHDADYNRDAAIIQSWLTMIAYTTGSWAARISMMLSTVRLIPTVFTLRRISEWAFISLLLMGISVLAAKLSFCASDLSWYERSNPVCLILAYIVADGMLIAIPLRLLYRISLPRKQRRMLLLMFGANIVTSMMAILYAVLFLSSCLGLLTLVTKIEAGVALIVANLAILTPYVYRLVNSEGDFDSKPNTYYRSFQPDGRVVLRRVSDIAPAPVIRQNDATGQLTTVYPTGATTASGNKGDADSCLHQHSFGPSNSYTTRESD
ncbi:hypothetical protein D9757_001007 [Collybiopsis confluens]|uniref:Rhodopsin domain-containing protein n=1 Tax=Collybiopsis confluens TaxID=2823264 RepID=A0A8H5HZY3_9AGAR|nr:hypothetical protein D9757_001007 [Collybiopsis confluens]